MQPAQRLKITTDIIGANQTVSLGVYSRTVAEDCRLPNDFVLANAVRIHRAYAAGEPIWMIVEELKLVHAMQRPAPTKTPRQLAAKVVRL